MIIKRIPREKLIFILALVLIVGFGVLSRFLPHPANFSPIGAMALFAGYLFPLSPFAFLIPLSALFLSDIILGAYAGLPFVYLGFALIFVFGSFFRRFAKAYYLPLGAVAGSLMFFILTNFGHWLVTKMYPPTLEGLSMSYIAGLPFLRAGLVGDLSYSLMFLGIFYGLRVISLRRLPSRY